MFKLLLLIILFIVFFPIVKMWLLMRRARNNMREAFDQARRHAGEQEATRGRSTQSSDYDGVGEYAEFEEVSGATREPEPQQPASTTANEQQVIDAEFEDI